MIDQEDDASFLFEEFERMAQRLCAKDRLGLLLVVEDMVRRLKLWFGR